MRALRIAAISAHTCPLADLGGWETGGMNVYVRELGRALGARGVEVDIFTRRQACDTQDVVEYAPNARVVHLDAGPRRHVDKYDVLDYLPEFACGVQRWRALTGASYDLIHSHYWLSGKVAAAFRDRWDVPMVSMFHTLAEVKNRVVETEAEREQALRVDIERRTMAVSDRIIAATEIDRGQMLRHYGEYAPITVIPGGVDLELFRPMARHRARAQLGIQEPRVVAFVGRVQRLKGLHVLLRAFALLCAEPGASPMRLLVVGGQNASERRERTEETREIARIKALAGRLGIRDQVSFVGALDQKSLPLYYSAADVTVVPSSYESFGLVAVESLACSTPVVATRVGGLTTIVRDGENGFLVPWRDPRLFAERIGYVLQDRSLRARLAREARPSVLRFSWDQIADRHIVAYQEAIASRSLPAIQTRRPS